MGLNNENQNNSASLVQCSGIKLNGSRCTRQINNQNKYCFQHRYSRKNDVPWYNNSIAHTIGAIASIVTIIGFIFSLTTGATISNQEEIKRKQNATLEAQKQLLENQIQTKEILFLVVEQLREELSFKDNQAIYLQDQLDKSASMVPSIRAIELALKIPNNASSYALALKAIAESRYEDARKNLDIAQEEKETELALIYSCRGINEMNAGNIKESVKWHDNAMELAPNDPRIYEPAAIIYCNMYQYQKAEPLLKRIRSDQLSSPIQDYQKVLVATRYLVDIYYETDRKDKAVKLLKREMEVLNRMLQGTSPIKRGFSDDYVKLEASYLLVHFAGICRKSDKQMAESICKKALDVQEKYLDPNDFNLGMTLNVLGMIYSDLNKNEESEKAYKRVIEIEKYNMRCPTPGIATVYNNMAGLYVNMGQFNKAENMYLQSIELSKKIYGDNHPLVAYGINNLTLLYIKTNRFNEAMNMSMNAYHVFEIFYGADNNITKRYKKYMSEFVEVLYLYKIKDPNYIVNIKQTSDPNVPYSNYVELSNGSKCYFN